MSNKHTPGPWTLTGKSGYFAIEAEPHGLLCAIRYLGNAPRREREQEDNARLIAAAPDLLAACEQVFNGPAQLSKPDGEALRLAIAKAKGETS